MVNFMKMGEPLDDNALAQMSKKEREFWFSFLHRANQEIAQRENKHSKRPFQPSASLKRKHLRAIKEYGGAKYCQVRQLEIIFRFK